MLKKDSFHWSDKAQVAFTQLKEAVANHLVLAPPKFSKPFIIECDASGFGVGVVLMQNHRPIAFHSQTVKGKRFHFSTYDKELLPLATAIKKWRPYLLGRPFVVKTDHQSLKFLLEQRIGTPAQQKWITKLMEYSFAVEYKKGIDNKVADALSRKLDEDHETEQLKCKSSSLFLLSFHDPTWINLLKDCYQQDALSFS